VLCAENAHPGQILATFAAAPAQRAIKLSDLLQGRASSSALRGMAA
jgi:hypothetical protein